MEKSKLNYIVDVLMGVAFVIASITGLVVFFFFAQRSEAGKIPGIFRHNKRDLDSMA